MITWSLDNDPLTTVVGRAWAVVKWSLPWTYADVSLLQIVKVITASTISSGRHKFTNTSVDRCVGSDLAMDLLMMPKNRPDSVTVKCTTATVGLLLMAAVAVMATADQEPTQTATTSRGKILMYPYVSVGKNSHIVSFVRLAKILRSRGYHVHLLIGADADAGSWDELDHIFDVVHLYPSANRSDIDYANVMLDLAGKSPYEFVLWITENMLSQCDALLSRPGVLVDMQRERYDLLFTDFVNNCGRIVSDYLNIPTIVHSTVGYFSDTAMFPDMPSFIPVSPMSQLEPGKMSFSKRIENSVEYVVMNTLWYPQFFGRFQSLREKYQMNSSLDVQKSYLRTLVLVRGDFVLDYPRPVMPNVVTIEGVFFDDPKPLPHDIAKFVDGAGSDGIIVVCFGTMIGHLDVKRNELYARVLARFPQRVVWRVTGTRPVSLGNNTLAVDWMPQNDLLRHASTRLFVSHCGLSSTMEAAHNAVPVVAMPICTDGFRNALKLTRAGMAFSLDFKTLTEDSLESAIWKVLNDPRYKRNASRVAALLNDTLVPPRDKFLYYVGYVIRHGGVAHWQADILQTMNNWQLFNYDMAALGLIVIIASLFLAGAMLWLCVKVIWRCSSALKPTNKEHAH